MIQPAGLIRAAWQRLAALTALLVIGSATGIAAQRPFSWEFLAEGRVLTRCAERSAPFTAASDRLRQLDIFIGALSDTEPVAGPLERLYALLRTECFLPAAESTRVPAPDTTASLKDWWQEGGRDWLWSYLQLPGYGPKGNLTPHIIVPPDPRPAVYLTAGSGYPFETVLCPAGDTRCGAPTQGWAARAEAAFEAHARRRERNGRDDADDAPAAVSTRCAGEVRALPERRRYQAWRTCVEGSRPRRSALPIGGFRAPAEGWLIVTGRRGHYNFCDGAAAYDLATGAAVRFESCSGLALRPGGSVDRAATDRARAERVRMGSLPIDNLREAVWLLLLRDTAEEIQVASEAYPLPTGMTPQIVVGEMPHGLSGFVHGGNTAQTRLSWALAVPGRPLVVGTLTWPDAWNGAEAHASTLLAIAEAGQVEGCLPRRPPPAVEVESARRVFLNRAGPRDAEELADGYGAALPKWETAAGCK